MSDEVGWLIEHRPGCAWWDGRSPETFTPDPNNCVRFARKEDAERVLANVIAEHNRPACIVTEHMWCAGPARPCPCPHPESSHTEPDGCFANGGDGEVCHCGWWPGKYEASAISDNHVSETDVILTVTPADAKKFEALIRERDAAEAATHEQAKMLRERDRRIAELEAALRFCDPRNATARYDRIADDFHRETGLWPPGRDAPAAMGLPEPLREEAQAKWRPFVDTWHERWFDAVLSPAPAAATGR